MQLLSWQSLSERSKTQKRTLEIDDNEILLKGRSRRPFFMIKKRRFWSAPGAVWIILLIFDPVQDIRSFRQMILWHPHTRCRTSP